MWRVASAAPRRTVRAPAAARPARPGADTDGVNATPRAARRRQQRRQTSTSSQLETLVKLWRQESARDAAAQQEAAEREAAALAVQRNAISAMDRVAGQMDRFADMMGEMVSVMRGSRGPR